MSGLCYYFSNRLLREQAAFNSAPGVISEGPTLLGYMPAGVSGTMDFLDLMNLSVKTVIDKAEGPDYENSDLYYQSTKSGSYSEGDSKAWIKFQRKLPYWRSYYTLTNPYDASVSYEYGRRVK